VQCRITFSALDIQRPTIFLDQSKALHNLHRMVEKAKSNNLLLRPHFKTHQSAALGRWFSQSGIRQITVSSVKMAQYFANAGWDDITIAFPVNILEWDSIVTLARRIRIQVVVSSPHVIEELPASDVPIGVFVKLDVGTHRTGFDPANRVVLERVVKQIRQRSDLELKGFLAHAGHSYSCRDRSCIQRVHDESKKIMLDVKSVYSEQIPQLVISVGDTPTCSVAEDWSGIDEIRPGNFIFYDLTQLKIGACSLEDIAVVLACPVVAKHDQRKTIVVYGGGIHLSKEGLPWGGKTIYGLPVELDGMTWSMPDEYSHVMSLSQEHGIIQASERLYDRVGLGDLLGILPVHSCMTCDLMKSYTLSDQSVKSMMPV